MKYLFSLIMVFCFVGLNAQVITNFTSNGDTVVNTATKNVTLILRSYYPTAVFQVVNTKISGTVAGTTYFQGSVDGTNYVNLDSLVNTDQTTNTNVFNQSPARYPYYRFRWTGVGTMSASIQAYAHVKK